MRRRVAVAAAGIVLGLQSTTYSQQPAFTANSELVVLHATVTSGKDLYVADLPREAFAVVEDGVPQQVSFLADADSPVTVGLLIDGSASMYGSRDLVIAAATAFAEAGHPDDEVFALAFNDEVRPALPPEAPFTSDPHVMREALEHAISARGRTALYDAIRSGLDYVGRGSRQRRVLVVVSDGGDNASETPLDVVLRKAQASNAVVYTIALVDPLARAVDPRPLRDVAAASGGEFFRAREPRQVGDVLRRISRDIRHAYTIGYVPTNTARDGRFHTIRVTVNDPSGRRLKVRTRNGYLAGLAR
jgi:Ca-activated chloride channel homolog